MKIQLKNLVEKLCFFIDSNDSAHTNLLKMDNKNTKTLCEIYGTTKTQWTSVFTYYSGASIFDSDEVDTGWVVSKL